MKTCFHIYIVFYTFFVPTPPEVTQFWIYDHSDSKSQFNNFETLLVDIPIL